MKPFQINFDQYIAQERSMIVRVYGWMTLALIVTGGVAYFVQLNPVFYHTISDNKIILFGLLLLELIAVWILVPMVDWFSEIMAMIIFLAYSIVNGLMLSIIFMVYTQASIASLFFITAGMFAVMGVYGYATKGDLSKRENMLITALTGIILASFVNFVLENAVFYWVSTFLCVFLFTGLAALDTEKLKMLFNNDDVEGVYRKSIIGALTLYLDLMNLFALFGRIFGRRKKEW